MKRLKNLQIFLIVIAFLITIGALFGGQALTTKLKVEGPLQRDLHRMKAIHNFKLKQEKDGITVTFKLKKVDNLEQVLDYVQQKVSLHYNQPVKAFNIIDHHNQYLEELRYQLSFYLNEAIVTGHYTQLKTALDSYRGVKAKAYISQNNIYLQLEKGSNYLYEVLPINLSMYPTKSNNIAGGDST